MAYSQLQGGRRTRRRDEGDDGAQLTVAGLKTPGPSGGQAYVVTRASNAGSTGFRFPNGLMGSIGSDPRSDLWDRALSQ